MAQSEIFNTTHYYVTGITNLLFHEFSPPHLLNVWKWLLEVVQLMPLDLCALPPPPHPCFAYVSLLCRASLIITELTYIRSVMFLFSTQLLLKRTQVYFGMVNNSSQVRYRISMFWHCNYLQSFPTSFSYTQHLKTTSILEFWKLKL